MHGMQVRVEVLCLHTQLGLLRCACSGSFSYMCGIPGAYGPFIYLFISLDVDPQRMAQPACCAALCKPKLFLPQHRAYSTVHLKLWVLQINLCGELHDSYTLLCHYLMPHAINVSSCQCSTVVPPLPPLCGWSICL